MSGRSGASGSVRSAGSARLAPPHAPVLDALYDRKRDNKSVRVLTVIIYVFCVSLAAIMLSLYYVFFWEPKEPHYAQHKVAHVDRQASTAQPMPTCLMPYTGGGNPKMSGPASTTPAPTSTSTSTTSTTTTTSTANSSSTIGVFNSTRPPDLPDYTNQDNTTDTISLYNETNAT